MSNFRQIAVGLTTALSVLSAPAALACNPVQVMRVYFDRNSAQVSAEQVRRLAEWMADLRGRYPNQESIDIDASAEPGERNPKLLGVERARNVAQTLRENLNSDGAKIHVPTVGYVRGPVSSYLMRKDKSQGASLQLDFLPACPHECPCQQGDPLYEPKAPR